MAVERTHFGHPHLVRTGTKKLLAVAEDGTAEVQITMPE